MNLDRIHSIHELRALAQRCLPRLAFDYLDGGAEDERTMAANRFAFEQWQLVPRPLHNVSVRDCSVKLWEQRWALPLGIAPIGLAGLFWPGADVAAARAAAEARIPYILSTASSSSLEEVMEANPLAWFQLYVLNEELSLSLMRRALNAGCRALVVTVDVAVGGRRERDLNNGLQQPLCLSPRMLAGLLARPRWVAQMLRHGQPDMANLRSEQAGDTATQAALLARKMDAGFDWERLARLRGQWPHQLIVKGLLHAEDVARAFSLGADAVVVSNHGGRQLDAAMGCLHALPDAVSAAQGKPVFFDSGIRRGSDILKALALGASAVFVGRAPMYGLACQGQPGVAKAIGLLAQELDISLALLGCSSIAQLNHSHLRQSTCNHHFRSQVEASP